MGFSVWGDKVNIYLRNLSVVDVHIPVRDHYDKGMAKEQILNPEP